MPGTSDKQERMTKNAPESGPTSPDRATRPSPRREPARAVWQNDELSEVHARNDKADKVRDMFGAIARSYDLNNRVHSLWRDEAWRRAAVRMAAVRPGETVLDMACGTGDLTQAFARRSPAGLVIGGDFTHAMLELAAHKRTRLPAPTAGRIRYIEADAMALPVADASVDVVSIAFGIRNVQDPDRAIAEFFRVLKPGGRVVILEFDQPRIAPVRWFNAFYCGQVMPRTATWISRDRSGAYRYLPRSVTSFMSHETLGDRLRTAGFGAVRHRSLSLGICVCTVGVKPGA
jgi:demethylmenaquinone methyltransferase/2-methoxy-6-polyprenyl-1,4-benzoquinol methylase